MNKYEKTNGASLIGHKRDEWRENIATSDKHLVTLSSISNFVFTSSVSFSRVLSV
jgi:hypothetical protein